MGPFRFLKQLYVQVLIGIGLGVVVGLVWPAFGASLEPLGKAFVNLVKMMIGPVIFCTVAVGVARMNDLKSVGRVGVKALVYFEVVSTLALILGWIVAEAFQPGAGFNYVESAADLAKAQGYVAKAHETGVVPFLMGVIPTTYVSAFSEGNLLQVLLVAILTGFGCARLGPFGDKAADAINAVAKVFFSIIHIVVRLAPIGAFGAMAFTVGKFGPDALAQLAGLVALFYATSLIFVLGVLGLIAAAAGFNIFKFIRYIREEILIVLGASSSEAALPQLMEKLQRLGAAKPVVGLVVPTGYSFNLDGTNIYMTLATLFLAQATNTDLSLWQIVTLLLVAMLTSKGASGVTGAGFITLAATLAVVPTIPIASLAILFGIDRFMSECRALTNFMGNGVATLVVARWDKQLDLNAMQRELDLGPRYAERDEVEERKPV